MLPKLNDMGDVQHMKIGKRENGKTHAEERKLVQSFYEYYIEVESEIEEFVNMFAVNSGTFNYKQYFEISKQMKTAQPSVSPILTPIQESVM